MKHQSRRAGLIAGCVFSVALLLTGLPGTVAAVSSENGRDRLMVLNVEDRGVRLTTIASGLSGPVVSRRAFANTGIPLGRDDEVLTFPKVSNDRRWLAIGLGIYPPDWLESSRGGSLILIDLASSKPARVLTQPFSSGADDWFTWGADGKLWIRQPLGLPEGTASQKEHIVTVEPSSGKTQRSEKYGVVDFENALVRSIVVPSKLGDAVRVLTRLGMKAPSSQPAGFERSWSEILTNGEGSVADDGRSIAVLTLTASGLKWVVLNRSIAKGWTKTTMSAKGTIRHWRHYLVEVLGTWSPFRPGSHSEEPRVGILDRETGKTLLTVPGGAAVELR